MGSVVVDRVDPGPCSANHTGRTSRRRIVSRLGADWAIVVDMKVKPSVSPASGQCPCGSGASYLLCCQPFHRGDCLPTTAEKLMRSRYSAFALLDSDYLMRTWHRSTRPPELALDRRQHWLGLRILGTTGGSLFSNTGTVEFVANFRRAGRRFELRELSKFIREDGMWCYLDGDVSDDEARPVAHSSPLAPD